MFCALSDLATESDVEQKLLWPLLTSSSPIGCGFASSDVLTKPSIRRIEIGKGSRRKLYFPDYIVDALEVLEKVLAPELKALRKGPLSLFEPSSAEYRKGQAHLMMGTQADAIAFFKVLSQVSVRWTRATIGDRPG